MNSSVASPQRARLRLGHDLLLRSQQSDIQQHKSTREERIVKSEIKSLIETAAQLEARGAAARSIGDEPAAEASLRKALRLTIETLDRAVPNERGKALLDILQMKVRLALRCGEVPEAKRALENATAADPSITQSEKWRQFFDAEAWPDEWLIAAVRRDPPDMAALDALADRYWKDVFGRCYLLTLNQDKACDLAQQAWVRVLRARRRLLPGGNFPAYVSTVATNLWRDAQRWSRRAGPFAEQKLVSLDQPVLADDGDNVLMTDALPSLNSPDAREQTILKLDIDRALQRLPAKLRDVLIARFITGESCAEIARRCGRTEQTVSGWVREAIRDMKTYLEEPLPAATPVEQS
jgi:RNA polymerase sigma-70 factor (ECF subfamily)